ncbi:MAG: PilN domain-containing protein [Chromatiales bacterium]|mgnify:FL=1|jgi:type IV pilus assembly protein PilN|nr:PilN domain-containing protein [Chromatiales bacterium]MDH3892949.1 PilN domain-containing protein [Chromatiales bacterium]MDH3931786.1 PilN domain-containing protein [Chromatiales bacterium]MDH3945440.1 PilN domain-containing protein [Chromatiales bacterium]MDH4012988.1 PilN domain-containing protein [Chromatiales bacterium]
MPRINLLPWREELRKERQKNFAVATGIAIVFGVLVVMFSNYVYNIRIEYQNSRNQLLRGEITALDAQIKEILDLEAKKERLLNRMEIIEQLQRSRPESVHLVEQLVRTVPDGVFLTSVKQVGQRLELKGGAESNTRVSAYMRNIDSSDWLTDPRLEKIEVVDRTGQRVSEFSITARQVSTITEDQG